jgi:hypothetical protein
MKRLIQIFVTGALVAVLTTLAFAAVPPMINYQGKLTNASGAPVNDTLQMVFTIYADTGGTTPLWTETQGAVIIEKGVFNVLLGSVDSIPYSVFDGNVRYLGVKVGDDQNEITPRKPMVSVGYAYRADTDGDWTFRVTDGNDTTLMTGGAWGIARYGNILYGNKDSTHVNLGVASTTGTNGQNFVYCTVGGGRNNSSIADYATIGGGSNHTARGRCATIGGGDGNTASGDMATIGGGQINCASGTWATVPGGYADTVAGQYSFAAGRCVKITSTAEYTFAFGFGFTTSTPNAVVFYNSYNPIRVGIGVTAPTHLLDVGSAYCDGSNWVNASSRKYKKDIHSLTQNEYETILAKLAQTDVVRYRYNSQDDDELHIGVIAEDAPEEIVDADRTGIPTGDAIGFLLAALKAQQEQIDALKAKLEKLESKR